MSPQELGYYLVHKDLRVWVPLAVPTDTKARHQLRHLIRKYYPTDPIPSELE